MRVEEHPHASEPFKNGTSTDPPKLSAQVEGRFLLGPKARGVEFLYLLRIAWEILQGMRTFHFLGPAVTVFGSARFEKDHRYYNLARETARHFARAGFAVMTGGGPGIMEAANRGAKEAGGLSVGANIVLPEEQFANHYLDKWMNFDFFFVRKLMLVKYSYAFVVFPGGFGTFDEVFETATLIQTGKIRDFPLIMMGRDYWRPVLHFMRSAMVGAGTIGEADVERLIVTDDPERAVQEVLNAATSRFGLEWVAKPSPQWLLGEKRPPVESPVVTGAAELGSEDV